jgi:hypothetical protein
LESGDRNLGCDPNPNMVRRTRVRQRVADEVQAERQRKQTVSDKKLQTAIAKDENFYEIKKKKITRNLARQITRKQLV